MRKRNLTLSEHGMIVALLLIGIAVVLACTGCASPRQNFYAGQGLDVVTTGYGLEIKDDYKEANPLCDNYEQVIVMKVVVVGLVEFAAWAYPESADTIYRIGAIGGYIAGGANLYTLSRNE